MLTRRDVLSGIPLAALARSGSGASSPGPMTLWYAKPAERWLDSLPIGNGRLGAMVFGGATRERVALNESTVWSGARSDDHENPTALEHLPEIRQLFLDGHYIQARDLCAKHLLGRQGSYGTHLPMAELVLQWQTPADEVRTYRGALDLEDGVARVTYTSGDAQFDRQYLASNPDGVIAIHLSASQPGLSSSRWWMCSPRAS